MSIPADPGVSAPTGDPDGLLAAASWHENLSGFFENTATTLQFTVGSLSGANWSGEAASSYQDLAGLVIGHFRQAATTASTAADALRRYGSKLDTLQREGVAAVKQVVHWMTVRAADQRTPREGTGRRHHRQDRAGRGTGGGKRAAHPTRARSRRGRQRASPAGHPGTDGPHHGADGRAGRADGGG